MRAPILVEARANARRSLDFVHDQLACGRRFRILNVVDDVTRECLAAIPDAIAERADDYNNFRPHSSLGYQTPADNAGTIAATGSNAAQDESFAFPPIAPTAPFGVFKTCRGSDRRRMKVQWQVNRRGDLGLLGGRRFQLSPMHHPRFFDAVATDRTSDNP